MTEAFLKAELKARSLAVTAPLLLQMCELSLEVFERLDASIENEAAKVQLRTLTNTMRKTVAMAKGEHLTTIPGDKQ